MFDGVESILIEATLRFNRRTLPYQAEYRLENHPGLTFQLAFAYDPPEKLSGGRRH